MKHTTSMGETYHEHSRSINYIGQNIRTVTTYIENCQNKLEVRSNTTTSKFELPPERSKRTTSMGVTYLENVRKVSQARSKHCPARTKYQKFDIPPKTIPRVRLKQTTFRVETYHEHGQNIARARSKQTTTTVGTYHEHGRNISRSRSKNTTSTAEICQEHG